MEVEKILIRGPNWVGDAVLAIPAMKAVRKHFSGAQITLLVRPWVAGLFSSASFVDDVWAEAKPSGIADWTRLTRDIRARRFDLALLLPNSFESALMIFLGGVPRRVGYGTDGRRWMLTDSITPAERPGAAYGSAKRWHEDRFADVADILADELKLRVALIGSEAERTIAEEIRSRMKSTAAVLNGKTSLETLIGVLAESSLMGTNDSGAMHIAAALGVPTVAVFGSTDDSVTGPYGPRTRIVKHPVECSPCLLRECPIDHRCMNGVTVEDVRRAAREVLASLA